MKTMMGPRQVDQAALFYEFSLGRAHMIPVLCREGEEGQEGVPALGQALRRLVVFGAVLQWPASRKGSASPATPALAAQLNMRYDLTQTTQWGPETMPA